MAEQGQRILVDKGRVDALRMSGEFDAQWYLQEYPDVALLDMDPAEHFVWIGQKMGRAGRGAKAHKASVVAPEDIPAGAIPEYVLSALGGGVRERLIESGHFDEVYYRERHGDQICFHDDLLADCIFSMYAQSFRDPNALFCCDSYLKSYPDVRGIHPLVHFVLYGEGEGRTPYSAMKSNKFLNDFSGMKPVPLRDVIGDVRDVHVLHWEKGNFFFADIARYTCDFLTEMGYRCTLGTSAPARSADSVRLVVAPHEFCVYGEGRDWTQDELSDAIYFNTEQWHTSWFALSLKPMRLARRGVIDINPSSAAGLIGMGMKAAFLPLLPLPGSCYDFQNAPLSAAVVRHKFVKPLTFPERFADRPYDVSFVGVANDRRAQALALLAPVLARYESFLHCPRFTRPLQAGDPDMLSASDITQIARNCKILLNIHQGDSHYLEWQRVFLVGMMEGCVTLSEPCTANSFIQPGVNYLEANKEDMPRMLDFLLGTDRGMRLLEVIRENNTELRQAVMNGERFQ